MSDKIPDGTLVLVIEKDGWVVGGKPREWPRLETVEGGKLSSPRKREARSLGMRCYVVPPEFGGLGLDSLVQAADAGSLRQVQIEFARSIT